MKMTWIANAWVGVKNEAKGIKLLSLLCVCCLAGSCNPTYAYLKDLFTRLPQMTNRQVKDITPKAWAREQQVKQAQDQSTTGQITATNVLS